MSSGSRFVPVVFSQFVSPTDERESFICEFNGQPGEIEACAEKYRVEPEAFLQMIEEAHREHVAERDPCSSIDHTIAIRHTERALNRLSVRLHKACLDCLIT